MVIFHDIVASHPWRRKTWRLLLLLNDCIAHNDLLLAFKEEAGGHVHGHHNRHTRDELLVFCFYLRKLAIFASYSMRQTSAYCYPPTT